VQLIEHADVLELNRPALEPITVVPDLSHARYPYAHVQLENRFLLELYRLNLLVVCALTESTGWMHSHGEETLLEFLVLQIAVYQVLNYVAHYIHFS